MSDSQADVEADTAQDQDPPEAPAAPSSDDAAPVEAGASESSPKTNESSPKTKKKKKKKPSAESSDQREAKAPAPLPGEGTPEGDKLREANVAFESGNYARVRELGEELERAQDPAVVDAARSLVRRVSVDPVQIAFLGACAIALMVITWIYILEPHSH